MIRLKGAALAGATVLLLSGLVAPAQAALPTSERAKPCDESTTGASARGGTGAERALDHRDITAAEQRAIEERTARILDRKGRPSTGVAIPTYVHVMAAQDGSGDVTDKQITRQMAVLNKTFGGGESTDASDSGFTFTLAGTDRFYNDTWHKDRSSSAYRSATRQGGVDALNIWLVDFAYLGIATFPWDYEKNGATDGIRVHYDSLPGGSIANYDLGETATHEAGHWMGLFHTFQGGCNEPGDYVVDTPAMSTPTNGCPPNKDTCLDAPGLDPIFNYMDYSYDSCYNQFTPDQSTRMNQMWTAYRAPAA